MRRSAARALLVLPLIAGMLMFGLGMTGQADAQGSSDDAGRVAAGEAVYSTSCAGCHGADGTGVAGLGRPLIGIASQGDRATHINSITEGKGTMPGFGDRLSAEEIEDSASYVRLTFVEAASSGADEELALTGVSTNVLALAGVGLLSVGAGLVMAGRRREG